MTSVPLAQTMASMEACMLYIKLTNKINVTNDLLNESLVFCYFVSRHHTFWHAHAVINKLNVIFTIKSCCKDSWVQLLSVFVGKKNI